MIVVAAEQFLRHLVINYGKHKVSSDGGTWYHPTSLQISEIKTSSSSTYSSFEKSIIYRKNSTIF